MKLEREMSGRETMRLVLTMVVLVVIMQGVASAQFKSKTDDETNVSGSLLRSEGDNLWFGWFDPNRFSMHQSFSLSYTSFGGQGISLGVYTNSMMYQISDPLSVQLDLSLVQSPSNSFGGKFGSDLSGIYLSRAALNYKPSENSLLSIQFHQLPAMYFLGNYGYGRIGGSALLNEEESH